MCTREFWGTFPFTLHGRQGAGQGWRLSSAPWHIHQALTGEGQAAVQRAVKKRLQGLNLMVQQSQNIASLVLLVPSPTTALGGASTGGEGRLTPLLLADTRRPAAARHGVHGLLASEQHMNH